MAASTLLRRCGLPAVALGLVTFVGCRPSDAPTSIRVENPLGDRVVDAPVEVRLDSLELERAADVRVFDLSGDGELEIPSQLDGRTLFFQITLDSAEVRTLEIRPSVDLPSYEPRVDAFLAVRHGGRIEDGVYVGGGDYERVDAAMVPASLRSDTSWAWFGGPVWESDRVGYRSYLEPGRNLVDVFGKRVPEPVLLHAEGDAHFLQPWGTDVLFVGNSLSLGTPAVLSDSGWVRLEGAASRELEIVSAGPLRAIIRTTFGGLPVGDIRSTVRSEQEIRAGGLWTEQRLSFDERGDGLQLVTGIVRHPGAPELHTGTESGIFYAYTWGEQSAQGDLLGLAVLVPEVLAPALVDGDSLNHVIRFEPRTDPIAYRYMAAWGPEPDAPGTEAAFIDAIRKVARTWAHPIRVERM